MLRNEEKFADAVPVLEKAKSSLVDTPGVWLKQTEEALEEVSNPGPVLVARIDALMGQGREKEARVQRVS